MARQTASLVRRQARLVGADHDYFVFLAILPLVLGALSLIVPGDDGRDDASGILVALNVAAVLMGTVLSIRDLVGERSIFRREQSVGLSASAYLAAKLVVFGLAAMIQSAILTTIVVLGNRAPAHGAALPSDPIAELYLTVATTTVVSAIVALAASSLAKPEWRILPMFVAATTVSLLLCGGIAPLTCRASLEQISRFLAARRGAAASAFPVDLRTIDPAAPHGWLWTHTAWWWVFDMGILMLFGVVLAGFVRWRLRQPSQKSQQSSTAPRK